MDSIIQKEAKNGEKFRLIIATVKLNWRAKAKVDDSPSWCASSKVFADHS